MPPFQTTSVRVECRTRSSTKQVFSVWSDPQKLRRVLAEATLDGEVVQLEFKPRVSAAMVLVVRSGAVERLFTGEILELDPPQRFSFTWVAHALSKETTLVTVDVAPAKSVWGGTDVVVTHERVRVTDADATQAWWTRVLDAVAVHSSRPR